MIRLHKWKLLAIALATNLTILLTLAVGEIKLWQEIDWLDIVGESGVCLLTALWLAFTLNSRPKGSVTSLLALGLGLIFIGSFQDLMDEVVAIPDASPWRGSIESVLMPIGLIVLTLALYHWHKEQLVFSQERRRKEQNMRDYRLQDQLTGLGDARFLNQQLEEQMQHCRELQQPLTLVLLDLDQFDVINRRFGHAEGDRLLKELTEVLLLNLRRCDLLCRYAGDRFAVVLPGAGEQLATQLCAQLQDAVSHFAYKTAQGESVYHSASAGCATDSGHSAQALIEQATQRLLAAKDKRAPRAA
ncbi:GGDEF domain-containing protein [Gilvimarinus sp. DA14]|uniref:GGDEF domain-containing protein n=1 Tax=Gilvimarinus sp. DA14 TaxID=2956798 RepID=UPI0020B8E7C7|nr:GGDEF domain-containing protein [Gilvimarinus sp. DA14]UTF59589.1 GGDEF domain-containing protein [Gilvimarinus sp. DA14]